jgi:hypothetical protein
MVGLSMDERYNRLGVVLVGLALTWNDAKSSGEAQNEAGHTVYIVSRPKVLRLKNPYTTTTQKINTTSKMRSVQKSTPYDSKHKS